jgi:hypothetical protein
LEARVAQMQAALLASDSVKVKDWRRAVEKYAGDEDLLAVFAEAKKLRDAERREVRRNRTRRTRS